MRHRPSGTPPRRMRRIVLAAAAASLLPPALAGCGTTERAGARPGVADSAVQALAVTPYDPSRDLGGLFVDAQMMGVYSDSKTLVDATPARDPHDIADAYADARNAQDFDIRAFVRREFAEPPLPQVEAPDSRARSMEQHIEALWPILTRKADVSDPRSSLLPLPRPYVVPGGRFREVYYWDSYFTMLGLVQSGRTAQMKHMLDNFAHLVRTVGHIPNANRTYYLSRSQPPYFAAMVGRYADATDSARAYLYLDAMEAEHRFWMDGADSLQPGTAHRRAVRLTDGAVLNRYWDDRPEPRPESFREDFTLALGLPQGEREEFYRNVRAAAESGWDFSSRWMRNPRSLRSLETTALVPVDLNSLLYHTEVTIAALRRRRAARGDAAVATRFEQLAADRKAAMHTHLWDDASGFYYDARWRTGELVTDRPSMAAAAPLYFRVATQEQASRVVARLERDFLKPGGFTTTLIRSGQQWDAPNGWPPLQWLGIEGARRYGHAALADSAAMRWLVLNRRVYTTTGKLTEKYDVWDLSRRAGGGEYPTQDGFGWTNGVALTLSAGTRR
jgi:alpha,alpha-trehalase